MTRPAKGCFSPERAGLAPSVMPGQVENPLHPYQFSVKPGLTVGTSDRHRIPMRRRASRCAQIPRIFLIGVGPTHLRMEMGGRQRQQNLF